MTGDKPVIQKGPTGFGSLAPWMLSRMHVAAGPHSAQGMVRMLAWPGSALEWMAESRAAMLKVIQQLGSTLCP